MFTTPASEDRTWRKSTRSGSNGCVEVSLHPHLVGVRDSKLTASPEFYVDAVAWRRFVHEVVTDGFARS